MFVTMRPIGASLGQVGAVIPPMNPYVAQGVALYQKMLKPYLTTNLISVKRSLDGYTRNMAQPTWTDLMSRSSVGKALGEDKHLTRLFYLAFLAGIGNIYLQRSGQALPSQPPAPVTTPPPAPPSVVDPYTSPQDRPQAPSTTSPYNKVLNSAMDYWLNSQRYKLRPEYVYYVAPNIYERFILEIHKTANAEGRSQGHTYSEATVRDAFEKRGYEPNDGRHTWDKKVQPSPYDGAGYSVRPSEPKPRLPVAPPAPELPPTPPSTREPAPRATREALPPPPTPFPRNYRVILWNSLRTAYRTLGSSMPERREGARQTITSLAPERYDHIVNVALATANTAGQRYGYKYTKAIIEDALLWIYVGRGDGSRRALPGHQETGPYDLSMKPQTYPKAAGRPTIPPPTYQNGSSMRQPPPPRPEMPPPLATYPEPPPVTYPEPPPVTYPEPPPVTYPEPPPVTYPEPPSTGKKPLITRKQLLEYRKTRPAKPEKESLLPKEGLGPSTGPTKAVKNGKPVDWSDVHFTLLDISKDYPIEFRVLVNNAIDAGFARRGMRRSSLEALIEKMKRNPNLKPIMLHSMYYNPIFDSALAYALENGQEYKLTRSEWERIIMDAFAWMQVFPAGFKSYVKVPPGGVSPYNPSMKTATLEEPEKKAKYAEQTDTRAAQPSAAVPRIPTFVAKIHETSPELYLKLLNDAMDKILKDWGYDPRPEKYRIIKSAKRNRIIKLIQYYLGRTTGRYKFSYDIKLIDNALAMRGYLVDSYTSRQAYLGKDVAKSTYDV